MHSAYMPTANGTRTTLSRSPLASTDGSDETTRTTHARPITTAPTYMVLKRPQYTSAIQPPSTGREYARMPNASIIADVATVPRPRAPAVCWEPRGGAPAPLPPVGRSARRKFWKTA